MTKDVWENSTNNVWSLTNEQKSVQTNSTDDFSPFRNLSLNSIETALNRNEWPSGLIPGLRSLCINICINGQQKKENSFDWFRHQDQVKQLLEAEINGMGSSSLNDLWIFWTNLTHYRSIIENETFGNNSFCKWWLQTEE